MGWIFRSGSQLEIVKRKSAKYVHYVFKIQMYVNHIDEFEI